MDAADPANALVRNELCEMSGIKGKYPQFFLVQGDRTSFFADFAEVEHMNEEGTLAEWLSMELPIAKVSSKNSPANETNKCTNHKTTTNNDDRSRISHSNSTKVHVNTNQCGVESDHEYASSSTTEDLLNVESVSKILDSFDTNSNVPTEQLHHQEQHISWNESRMNDDNKNMILTIPTTSAAQDEWSDPMLLERYKDEILALEDFLQDRDEEEGGKNQHPQRVENSLAHEEEIQSKKLKQQKFRGNNIEFTGAHVSESQNLQSSSSCRRTTNNYYGNKNKDIEKKAREDGRDYRKEKRNSSSSLSSTATTVTISPTSSTSRSPDRRHRLHQKPAVGTISLNLPSPPPLSYHKNKNRDKDIFCLDTVSTRSETEQLLQPEVKGLRLRCERLTAERYILEGQLKEVRQRSKIMEEEKRSSDNHVVGMIHNYQLQQTMRCAHCNKVFQSDPSSLHAPIASQACGHSVCRNCCHRRLSVARLHKDENTMNSSEHLRNTISSDLFMCGMGDMSHVLLYSPSFEERQKQLQECESCPICRTPRSFRQSRLNVNESLCMVLKLLENQSQIPGNVV